MQLASMELCDRDANFAYFLTRLEAGTVARYQVLVSLDDIRRVMIRRSFHF